MAPATIRPRLTTSMVELRKHGVRSPSGDSGPQPADKQRKGQKSCPTEMPRAIQPPGSDAEMQGVGRLPSGSLQNFDCVLMGWKRRSEADSGRKTV